MGCNINENTKLLYFKFSHLCLKSINVQQKKKKSVSVFEK